jgi:glycosyltransferase involved in cell wall biosynthesis
MRIVFIASNCVPFHSRSLEERPLGGTETATIRLSSALHRRGHEVFVVTGHENPPLSSPLYLPLRAIEDLPQVDVVIAVRDWQATLVPVRAQFRALWTGDAADQPATLGLGDKRVIDAVDMLLLVSHWHAETVARLAQFPLEKIFVLRNGIHPEYFSHAEQKDPHRLIYSSTPYRGLEHIPRIFAEIHRQIPTASMHVFSAFDVYAGAGKPPQEETKKFKALKAQLASLPGCFVHGNILQSALAKEYLKSSVLLYPNTFAETSCITVMEAQAAGCVPVTTALGALPETVGSSGILIQGNPGNKDYDKQMIESTLRIISDPRLYNLLASIGLRRAVSMSWDERALELELCLLSKLKTNPVRKSAEITDRI